ncbi:FGFR1 oncogene partner-like isoform X2 [Mizuhopecten yessoensis]|uniref:FGFR1 oncogene partner-like isoform X2 n=1 Tax=Mizuhopecten yessoensis TaxID=6573 RepID=UPI000B45871B|nr:FGFR1 oncogene partner-like isoform X2 [Mizuhopecten yessoensis]
MSADEDTELRDLVAQTLETNGVLGKIRAQLRASVFLALEDQESVQNKTPFSNPDLKKYLKTTEGRTAAALVREFLEFFNLEFTLAVFDPEAGIGPANESRASLARELNLVDSDGPPRGPLFTEVVRQAQGGQGSQKARTKSATEEGDTGEGDTNIPKELTKKQLVDAQSKFDYYDKDRNGEIDKDELRELFMDMFPNFNRNMLDRYVNDELRAADRDFSSSINFDEFEEMYKRLFILCRTVVAGDVADIVPQPRARSPHSRGSLSEGKSFVDSKNQKNLLSGRSDDLRNGPNKHSVEADLMGGSDIEEDPFFDDPMQGSAGLKMYGGIKDEPQPQRQELKPRPSQIPVYSSLRSDERGKSLNGSSLRSPPPNQTSPGGGLSSLQGLPMLNQQKPRKQQQHDGDDSLRNMDRDLAGLGIDGDGDFDYDDDDFVSEGHSVSTKSPRTVSKSEQKSVNENGSIAEEIEEDIDENSIDGDDLLRSERSGFDDLTTDRTISQHDGFDYIEDVQSP